MASVVIAAKKIWEDLRRRAISSNTDSPAAKEDDNTPEEPSDTTQRHDEEATHINDGEQGVLVDCIGPGANEVQSVRSAMDTTASLTPHTTFTMGRAGIPVAYSLS